MLPLINELLNITARNTSFLNEALQQLLEHLGTLKELKLGKLAKALNQHYATFVDRSSHQASEIKNKFSTTGYNSGIKNSSPIVQGPRVKDFADLKKAFKTHGALAAALYEDGHEDAFALLIDEHELLSRPSQAVGFAYDLTKTSLPKERYKDLQRMLGDHGLTSPPYPYDREIEKDASTSRMIGRNYQRKTSYNKVDDLEKHAGKKANLTKETKYTDYHQWLRQVDNQAYERHRNVKTEGELITFTYKGEYEGKMIGQWNKASNTGFVINYHDYSQFNDKIEKEYRNEDHFEGTTIIIGSLKTFFDAVAKELKVTCKLVLTDQKSRDLNRSRIGIQPRQLSKDQRPYDIADKGTKQEHPIGGGRYGSDEDFNNFRKDLVKRIALYKNTKLVSIDDAREFLKMAIKGSLKKINFQGRTYLASLPNSSEFAMGNLLRGKPVEITFRADDTWMYSLVISVQLINNVLTPVLVKYTDVDGKSQERDL